MGRGGFTPLACHARAILPRQYRPSAMDPSPGRGKNTWSVAACMAVAETALACGATRALAPESARATSAAFIVRVNLRVQLQQQRERIVRVRCATRSRRGLVSKPRFGPEADWLERSAASARAKQVATEAALASAPATGGAKARRHVGGIPGFLKTPGRLAGESPVAAQRQPRGRR